jgi:hypothetical protein
VHDSCLLAEYGNFFTKDCQLTFYPLAHSHKAWQLDLSAGATSLYYLRGKFSKMVFKFGCLSFVLIFILTILLQVVLIDQDHQTLFYYF